MMNKLQRMFTKEYTIQSPLTPEEAICALSPHINNEIFWIFKKPSIFKGYIKNNAFTIQRHKVAPVAGMNFSPEIKGTILPQESGSTIHFNVNMDLYVSFLVMLTFPMLAFFVFAFIVPGVVLIIFCLLFVSIAFNSLLCLDSLRRELTKILPELEAIFQGSCQKADHL